MRPLHERVKRGECLEYKTNNRMDCLTHCPHRTFKRVGSIGCRMCDHHAYEDQRDQFVICFYKVDNGIDEKPEVEPEPEPCNCPRCRDERKGKGND